MIYLSSWLAIVISAYLCFVFKLTTTTEENGSLHASLKSSMYEQESYSCPAWTNYDQKEQDCKCFSFDNNPICTLKKSKLTILKNYCITYDKKRKAVVAGDCIYSYSGGGRLFYSIPLHNESELEAAVCSIFNRRGTLCSECDKGMHIPSYSYYLSCKDCLPKTGDWIKYFTVTFAPITLFYVGVIVFKINVHSSWLQGYVFISQFTTSAFAVRITENYFTTVGQNQVYKFANVYGFTNGIWNLDFFRTFDINICLGLPILEQLSLDLIAVLYSLFLIFATYFLVGLYDKKIAPLVRAQRSLHHFAKFLREKSSMRSSTIDVFATFLILGNVKLLNICFDILKPARVFQLEREGNRTWSVFLEPDLPYFGRRHFPFAILAMTMLFFFAIAPAVFLILYPVKWFQQRLIQLLPSRWQIFLNILVDSFQGIYKDGTEPGTKDCRWFSAMPFVVRFLLFSTYMYSYDVAMLINFAMILALTAVLTLIVDPYKPGVKYISNHFVFFILLLASILMGLVLHNIFSLLNYTMWISLIVVAISFTYVYLFYFIICWMVKNRRCKPPLNSLF